MNAFSECCNVEAAGMDDLVQFLEKQSDSGRFVLTSKGALSKQLQKQVGDAMLNRQGSIFGVEFKVESENKHGNFFLETWSNLPRRTPGWMVNLNTDVLLYYFLAEKVLFSIPFQRLCQWAFGSGRDAKNEGKIYQYKELRQSKYRQLSVTYGRCVPISVIEEEVGFNCYKLGAVDE